MKLSTHARLSILALATLTSIALSACSQEPETVTVIKEIPVEKEVIREVEKEVIKEVIKEVPVEKIVEKIVEVVKEAPPTPEPEIDRGAANLPDGHLRGAHLAELLELLRRTRRVRMDRVRPERPLGLDVRVLRPAVRLGPRAGGRLPDGPGEGDRLRRRVLDGRGPAQDRRDVERRARAGHRRLRVHRQHGVRPAALVQLGGCSRQGVPGARGSDRQPHPEGVLQDRRMPRAIRRRRG